ncbi:two-component response regulator ORR41 [Zea mays]|uniref:Response regulator 24 n=1 Tax=Zea mays TaxID=4577 RepID=A0A1D6L3N2_MAIZE|nr:two-component response regulator ORR41 [Zea mays]ONM09052.1 response regulator 24 [Zea mays]|eukprot:XP_008665397.1 two-component response regulator ORR41 [Zea mays]
MAGAAAERKVIRVLLVEDEEIHRVLARALLRSACGGVELHEAGTGAEAVRRVRDGGAAAAYDLIITDWKMPVMDGHEATRQIRAMGVTTPIVGLSSDTLPPDVDAFIKAGADDFTPKPLSKEKLVRILTKFHLA